MFELFSKKKTTNISKFPKWRCPSCQSGVLTCDKQDVITRETTASKAAHSDAAWDPTWIGMSFAAFLRCDNAECGDVVVATGPAGVSENQFYGPNGEPELDFEEHYSVVSVVPAPPLFLVKECVPVKISNHLDVVFALFWIDPSAAIGKLRVCVEDILTDKKIKRFTINKGKRNKLNLHSRIELFGDKNPDASATLMAIKWIGNAGSHAGGTETIFREDVVEVLQIFEHALDQIYDTKSKVLAKKIAVINKRKGL